MAVLSNYHASRFENDFCFKKKPFFCLFFFHSVKSVYSDKNYIPCFISLGEAPLLLDDFH